MSDEINKQPLQVYAYLGNAMKSALVIQHNITAMDAILFTKAVDNLITNR